MELNRILFWFNVVWFKTDLHVDNALILYRQLKKDMNFFTTEWKKYTVKDLNLKRFSSQLIRLRLIITVFIGIIIPLMFIFLINLQDYSDLISIFTIILVSYYISSILFLYLFSLIYLSAIDDVFKTYFGKELDNSYEYWIGIIKKARYQ